MKLILIYIFFIFSYLYSSSFKQEKLQIGFAISPIQAKTKIISNEILLDFTVKTSYELYNYLDLELRYSKSILHPNRLKHKYTYGLYLKPTFTFENELKPYLLLGYSKNSLARTNKNYINATTSQGDISYGTGLQYDTNKNWGVFFDYLKLINKSTTTNNGAYAINIDMLSFGINYRFNTSRTENINKVKDTKSKILKSNKILKHIKIKKTNHISKNILVQPNDLLYYKKNKISYKIKLLNEDAVYYKKDLNDPLLKHISYMKKDKLVFVNLQSYSRTHNTWYEKNRLKNIYKLLIVNGIEKKRIHLLIKKTNIDKKLYNIDKNFIIFKYFYKEHL